MTPIPAGWKLVPIEPTTEILNALRYAVEPDSAADSEDAAREVWAAMLAAAPTPPATTQDEPITVFLDPDPRGVSVGVWQGLSCLYTGAHAVPASVAPGDAQDELTRDRIEEIAHEVYKVERFTKDDEVWHNMYWLTSFAKAIEKELRRPAPAAGDALDAQAAVRSLQRYGFGYADDGNGARYLSSLKRDDGAFLRRDEVLAALAAQQGKGGE